MVTVKLSSKHQIVIPREARERLDLEPGDRLMVSLDGDRIVMERTPASRTGALAGALRGAYGDVAGYVARERGSWEEE